MLPKKGNVFSDTAITGTVDGQTLRGAADIRYALPGVIELLSGPPR